ncbi:MAG: DUF4304 domain-containing protein [Candidatus Gracilibacteria bacterium]|jgi:hypothetical protein
MTERQNVSALDDPQDPSQLDGLDNKEVRKLLVAGITEVLRDFGFKKNGYSSWTRKVGSSLHLVYLQRSQVSHNYYIEFGICEDGAIPARQKPDIADCKKRERIDHAASAAEVPEVVALMKNQIHGLLNFQGPEDEYQWPRGLAGWKIDEIKKLIRETVPIWFSSREKIE